MRGIVAEAVEEIGICDCPGQAPGQFPITYPWQRLSTRVASSLTSSPSLFGRHSSAEYSRHTSESYDRDLPKHIAMTNRRARLVIGLDFGTTYS